MGKRPVGSVFRERTIRERTGEQEDLCPRCGRGFDQLRDPLGRWFVCVRCGVLTSLAEPPARLASAPRT
ncbi:MAG: hypothetical protein ACRDHO_03985 [Actinomycetota bacterium]